MPARGNNGNHRPISAEGLAELASLESVDTAAELAAVDAMLVHVLRRVRVRRAQLHGLYRRQAEPRARQLGHEPTALAEIVPEAA